MTQRTPEGDRVSAADIAVAMLVEAGAALAESLAVNSTLQRVAALTVPELADLCVIDLVGEDGAIMPVATAAADPSLGEDVRRLDERKRINPRGTHPVARVIREGSPLLLNEVADREISPIAIGPRHLRLIADARFNSAIVAPLVARGTTLGTLSVLRVGEGRPYADEDVDLLCELARRAALAIDNARLFELSRAAERRLEATLVNVAEPITLTDAEDTVLFANPAAARLFGADAPAGLVGIRQTELLDRFVLLDERGVEISPEEMPRRRAFGGDATPRQVRLVSRETGEERWVTARPAPVSDPNTGEISFCVNAYEDVTAIKRLQLTESFMAQASLVLASSLDYEETLGRIAQLAVPRLADWCVIDVLDEAGEIVRVALHHRDPDRLELARTLVEDFPHSFDEQGGVPEVIRTGRAQIFPTVTRDALATYARDAERLELLDQIGLRSVIIVPLAGPTQTTGAITLVTSESKRRLSEDDVSLATRLGRRAGTAVEAARLFTARSRIAATLQTALLPRALPAVPGVQMHSLFRAAGALNEVGGDFYDVYPCGQDTWMLTIGDVCGKGPHAAGVTALARHTLRTAARLGQPPEAMLATLHDALRDQPDGADMCTVCLVTLRPGATGAELTVTLAGHPPPLLLDADGTTTELGELGTLVGVIDQIGVSEVPARLTPGQTLLLYTDGLPEARRESGAQDGAAWLGDVHGLARQPLADLVEHIEQRALERAQGRLRDDIALLAIRAEGPREASGRP